MSPQPDFGIVAQLEERLLHTTILVSYLVGSSWFLVGLDNGFARYSAGNCSVIVQSESRFVSRKIGRGADDLYRVKVTLVVHLVDSSSMSLHDLGRFNQTRRCPSADAPCVLSLGPATSVVSHK